jgi:hypothetical protein
MTTALKVPKVAQTEEEAFWDLIVLGTSYQEVIVDEGDFIDPVYGKCNIKKALSDRANAVRSEYEAFDSMHRVDGINVKSKLCL